MDPLHRLRRDVPLSEEERILLESVRQVAKDVIAPNASHYDDTGEFPWKNIRAMNDLGLNGVFIPAEFGGAGLSHHGYLACLLEISSACAATGIIWATNFHSMKPVVAFGNQDQKERFLPRIASGGLGSLVISEAQAGSDATGMTTSFREDGDDILINGSKIFITNGDVADVFLVFGKWYGIDDPRRAISAVVVEKGTPGLRALGLEKKMGHRASSTAALSFDNCRVPRANLLRNPGDGLQILFASLNRSRPSVAAHALGIAHAAFRKTIAYIADRRAFGRRIGDNQGVQFMIADLAAELLVVEGLLWRVADLLEQDVEDLSLESSILKLKATDLAMKAAETAVQLHGGFGYCVDGGVERLMRDAKITQIWEGANELHRQLIGGKFVRSVI